MKRKNGYEINHQEKVITLTQAYNSAASKRGSAEYMELLEIKAELPDYTVILRSIKKAEGKRTYRNLTYDNMETFITEKHSERLTEFQKVKADAPAHGNGAYTFVKKWFLDNFKAEVA